MRLINIVDQVVQSAASIVGATTTGFIDATGIQTLAYVIQAAVGSFSARLVASAAISPTDNTFTFTAHGFVTGLVVQVSTSGTLPAPLVVLTNYFVIVVDANTFKLALTLADALAGTPVDLSTAGTGNQTVTPTALAGASVKLQRSLDGVLWVDDGSATNITVTANVVIEKTDPGFRFYRLVYALTSGALTVSTRVLGKGPQ